MKTKLQKLMKRGTTTAVAVACSAWLCLMVGCSKGVTKDSGGGVTVSDGNGSCTVYIVEKDGYKFAVAVGYYKCAITQIKE